VGITDEARIAVTGLYACTYVSQTTVSIHQMKAACFGMWWMSSSDIFLREYTKEVCNLISAYLSYNYKLRMAYPHKCNTYIKMFVYLKYSNIC
jgi:hypothetical protein